MAVMQLKSQSPPHFALGTPSALRLLFYHVVLGGGGYVCALIISYLFCIGQSNNN